MFTRDKENMREYNYMNSIELLARDCSRDIQATIELMGESYASVVDYTMYSSRLGTWYRRLLEADKEFGAYDGHRDSIFRVIKLSDDLKQDVKAYQASCDKQAELLENYYFSNKNTADTKWLNIYNHKFSRDNRGGYDKQGRLPACILCPGRRHWIRYCPYNTPEKRRNRLENIGRCRACTVSVYEHGILCCHRARCNVHPHQSHIYWTCDGPRYRHPGPQTEIVRNITALQNGSRNQDYETL